MLIYMRILREPLFHLHHMMVYSTTYTENYNMVFP